MKIRGVKLGFGFNFYTLYAVLITSLFIYIPYKLQNKIQPIYEPLTNQIIIVTAIYLFLFLFIELPLHEYWHYHSGKRNPGVQAQIDCLWFNPILRLINNYLVNIGKPKLEIGVNLKNNGKRAWYPNCKIIGRLNHSQYIRFCLAPVRMPIFWLIILPPCIMAVFGLSYNQSLISCTFPILLSFLSLLGDSYCVLFSWLMRLQSKIQYKDLPVYFQDTGTEIAAEI